MLVNQINQLVYQFYDLTEEEIKIIENASFYYPCLKKPPSNYLKKSSFAPFGMPSKRSGISP
jgi:hypothetical protein